MPVHLQQHCCVLYNHHVHHDRRRSDYHPMLLQPARPARPGEQREPRSTFERTFRSWREVKRMRELVVKWRSDKKKQETMYEEFSGIFTEYPVSYIQESRKERSSQLAHRAANRKRMTPRINDFGEKEKKEKVNVKQHVNEVQQTAETKRGENRKHPFHQSEKASHPPIIYQPALIPPRRRNSSLQAPRHAQNETTTAMTAN